MSLAVLLALSPLLSCPLGPTPQEARDPMAGVWKGWGLGDGRFFSTHGVPATLLLRRGEGGGVEGTAIFQGGEMERLRLTFDPDAETLKVAGVIYNMPVQAELALEGERLSGKLAGIGVFVDVELERWRNEVLEAPEGVSGVADLASLSEDDWRHDLEFLRDYLPQVHADAFHAQTKAEWRAAIEAAGARLPELDPSERALELARLVSRIGDAHTGLNWREGEGFPTLPIWIGSFSDGLFVTGVHEAHADALAGRIVRVGATPIDEALATLASVVSAENDAWRTYQTMNLLAVPRLLAILGLVESPEALALTVENAAGDEVEVRIDFERGTPWLMAPDPKYDPIPAYMRSVSKPYWFEPLEDERAVYVAYNACRQDPNLPMGDFMTEVLAAFDDMKARRLIVDLRNNSGGSTTVLSEELGRLKRHPRIGAPGGLVALIGPKTYSSGMRGAYDLRDEVGGSLVGTPTGGRPNSYGEVRTFRLPRTGLMVFHSTKYFSTYEDQDPDSVLPDEHVQPSSGEYFAGEDPALEAALRLER